jgi:phosphatidylglycerol---prolipoprotein diacylglyceryl transferase
MDSAPDAGHRSKSNEDGAMIGLELPFPHIDPVAFSLGPISVKWYGLAYLTGLILGSVYIRRLLQTPRLWAGGTAPFDAANVDDLLIYMTIGVIVGGRLGSVLLYEPSTYLHDPLKILMIWKGGMAFHGALLGTGAAAFLFARAYKAPVLSVMDTCAAAVPIGLCFGRLANFINGELFGRPSDVPWAMVFPNVVNTYPQFAAIEPVTRHPSQLYEAALEGLLLWLMLRAFTHLKLSLHRPGLTLAVFLIGYGCARSFCEFFRQPDPAHALTAGLLTPGIAYSLPMIALGLYVLRTARPQASA